MLIFGGYEVENLPPIVTTEKAKAITGSQATDDALSAGIAAASATVRNLCGWHVAPSLWCEYETECEGFTEIQLPATFVTEVAYVKINGEDAEYAWKPNGRIRRKDGRPFPAEWGSVKIKYKAGHEPEEVEQIISKMAASSVAAPAGVRSESVGSASITYATTSLDDAITPNMRMVLDCYRLKARP